MKRDSSLALAASLALMPTITFAATETQQRPNVIVILVDDVGYGDYACYGHPTHKTPNLDKLASEGIKFTDFHSNGAVSSPTRAALLSGRYQQHFGIEGVITAAKHRDVGLPLGTTTIASLLKANGYKTAMFGKWHLGYPKENNPINYGFEKFVGYVAGNVDYYSHIDQEGYEDWWHQDSLVKEEGYTTYLITEHAEKYIKETKDDPFFLYVAHEAAHGPWQGPSDPAIRSIENGEYRVSNLSADPQRSYTEMIEALDECVGRVMKSVEEAGIAKNTLILLMSDNGGAKLSRNAPCSGYKASLLEGGHRVAAMAYWKGVIEGGEVNHETLTTVDILPTICEVTDTKYDGKLSDGDSFLGVLTKGEKMGKRTLFWRSGKSVAARRGDYKLLINRGDGSEKLFNLKEDIGEKHDIAAQNPKMVSSLKNAITKWERNFEDVEVVAK